MLHTHLLRNVFAKRGIFLLPRNVQTPFPVSSSYSDKVMLTEIYSNNTAHKDVFGPKTFSTNYKALTFLDYSVTKKNTVSY